MRAELPITPDVIRAGRHARPGSRPRGETESLVARVVEEAGRKAVLVRGDITDPAHCCESVRRAVEAFGRIDVPVNNAAFQMSHEPHDAISDEDWDRTFSTNIGAMLRITSLPVRSGRR